MQLKDNWAGNNVLPIKQDTYQNAKYVIKLIEKTSDAWNLSLNINGTLLLTVPNKESVSISIDNERLSLP